jgi:hypothetical protein
LIILILILLLLISPLRVFVGYTLYDATGVLGGGGAGG